MGKYTGNTEMVDKMLNELNGTALFGTYSRIAKAVGVTRAYVSARAGVMGLTVHTRKSKGTEPPKDASTA